MQRLRADTARRAQRGQLAIAMPAGSLRRNAKMVQQTQCALAHRAERGLGNVGGLERLVLLLARGVGERRVRVDDIA